MNKRLSNAIRAGLGTLVAVGLMVGVLLFVGWALVQVTNDFGLVGTVIGCVVMFAIIIFLLEFFDPSEDI